MVTWHRSAGVRVLPTRSHRATMSRAVQTREGEAAAAPSTSEISLTQLIARPDSRTELQRWLDGSGTLLRAAERHPEAETLRGRGLVYVVPRPDPGAGSGGAAAGKGERWVVRHYHRGGAVASLLGDLYVRVGTPRPIREFAAGKALAAAGVPTPRVIGAAVYPAGPFYRGDLVTQWVAGSRDLGAVLFAGGQVPGGGADGGKRALAESAEAAGPEEEHSRRAMRAAGELLRLAHERGLEHPDLNVKNILVVDRPDGVEAMVLDLDRARVRAGAVGAARRRRMIQRFWRSVRKWEARTGQGVAPELRAAFEAGYAGRGR